MFIKDSWEESQSIIHMALRDAICRGDVNTTRTILSDIGSNDEFIVNMAPNGSTTLLYWYLIFIAIIYNFFFYFHFYKYLYVFV